MNYWDNRYKRLNGNDIVLWGSGLGSAGDAVTKRINALRKHCTDVKSILDVGCGDMNVGFDVMELYPDATYKGIDSSEYLINCLKKQYPDEDFEYIENSTFDYPSDLVICFDVLYHIMDDKEHDKMLESLKKSWKKYLVIITEDIDVIEDINSDYIKHRIFNPNYFSDNYEVEDDIENSLEPEKSFIKMYVFKK